MLKCKFSQSFSSKFFLQTVLILLKINVFKVFKKLKNRTNFQNISKKNKRKNPRHIQEKNLKTIPTTAGVRLNVENSWFYSPTISRTWSFLIPATHILVLAWSNIFRRARGYEKTFTYSHCHVNPWKRKSSPRPMERDHFREKSESPPTHLPALATSRRNRYTFHTLYIS